MQALIQGFKATVLRQSCKTAFPWHTGSELTKPASDSTNHLRSEFVLDKEAVLCCPPETRHPTKQIQESRGQHPAHHYSRASWNCAPLSQILIHCFWLCLTPSHLSLSKSLKIATEHGHRRPLLPQHLKPKTHTIWARQKCKVAFPFTPSGEVFWYLLWLKVYIFTRLWLYFCKIFFVSSSVLKEFMRTRGTSVL